MTCSRSLVVALTAGLTVVSPAVLSAQTRSPRVTVSVLTTREHVAIDNAEGTVAGTGAALSLRLTRFISIYGELTAGSGEALDSDRIWRAGTGSGFGVTFHTPFEQRVGVSVSAGLSGRSFTLTEPFTGAGTITSSRQHGGVTFAVGLPVKIARAFVIEPETRLVQTLADEDFSARAIGVKAGWRF